MPSAERIRGKLRRKREGKTVKEGTAGSIRLASPLPPHRGHVGNVAGQRLGRAGEALVLALDKADALNLGLQDTGVGTSVCGRAGWSTGREGTDLHFHVHGLGVVAELLLDALAHERHGAPRVLDALGDALAHGLEARLGLALPPRGLRRGGGGGGSGVRVSGVSKMG